jgi:hypothetical protein
LSHALKEINFHDMSPGNAIRSPLGKPLGANHTLAKLALGCCRYVILLDGGSVATAAAETQLTITAALRHVEQAILDLVPSADCRDCKGIGAEFKLARFACVVQEGANQVWHASFGVVGMPGTGVHERVLNSHLLAHGTVKVASLVLTQGNVAHEPGIGNALCVECVCSSSSVVGKLLKESGKMLDPSSVEFAVFRVGGTPMRRGHKLGKPASWATRIIVPRPSVEALVLHQGGKVRLVLDAPIRHCHKQPQGTDFGYLPTRNQGESGETISE